MKEVLKRSLAIACAALVLLAAIPLSAIIPKSGTAATMGAASYTPVSGTSGDSSLLDKVADTSPAISVDKESYTVGEPIYVTAKGGTWVGLYRADQTNYANTKSIFWYYVDGHEGRAFDIRTASYNPDNPLGISPALFVGSYTAVLFSTNDGSSPVKTVTFNVTDANGDTDDANSYVTTNKATYYYGEPIVVTAKSSNTAQDQAWVGVYPEGANYKNTTSSYYYYVAGYQNTSVNIKNVSVNNNGANLAAGNYDVYLFGDSGYNKIQAQTTISITGGSIETNKTSYGYGEDIIVTATSCTISSDAWVGIYKKSDLGNSSPNGSVVSRSWYYLSEYPYLSVVPQDLTDNDKGLPLTNAEPGEYIAYVFGNSGYNDIQASTTFTIEENVTGFFKNGVYQVDDINDGFANGTVVLHIDEDYYGYVGKSDVAMFWADKDGKPLEGYTSLAKTKLQSNMVAIDMYTHTFIPEDAETLVAYVSSNGAVGTQGYKIDLPSGCATYTGLDENILSEFQMISDIHVTSDKVTKFEDGRSLINSWHHDYDNLHFEMMLNDVAENSPESVGIFINGDIANNGLRAEYNEVQGIYDKVESDVGKDLPDMHLALGNHDSYPGNINEFVSYANSLGADITTTAPYHAKYINGYKYIFLAGDNSAYYGKDLVTNSDDAELSQAQLQWLDEQLADNEQNNLGKPVFVMLHQSIEDTVAGSFSWQEWDGVVNVDQFKAVLNKYDNVILLGGHSHWEINSPNNMFAGSADLPVAVNTASVGYLWTDYNGTGEYMPGTQGFYVRTYADKTVFLGRDFENQKWIPSACYVLYNEDVSAESMSLSVDDEKPVSEYLTNAKDRDLTFATSDKNVVQVDANGNLTATGIGTATITVTAAPTDTEVVKREKFTVTVTNQTISDDIQAELGEPLNLGDDFSAYIGYVQNGTEYVLTIPGDEVSTNRTSPHYSTSQGFTTSNDMTVYYPEFMQKNNKSLSVRQFWDFERQDDGSYVILNTWTNATHSAYDPKVPYALDGGSYSYYKETIPTADNNVDNALTATRYYYTDESYTSTSGEYSSYYRWYIYMDNEGNYYLKSKHTGYILSLNMYNDQHWFGKMGKMLTESDMAKAAVGLDRIATNDNIKMSLFDYGKYINNNSYIAIEARKFRENGVSSFDASKNDNILWFNQDAWQDGYVVDGVATLEESLKDSDDITVDNIGNPSQYDSTPLMLNSLDSTGYPYVNNVTYHDWDRLYGDFDNHPAFGSDSGSLKYLFDQDMTYVTGDSNTTLTADNYHNGYYQSVRYDVGDQYGSGMFKEASSGGMVYSSYMNAAYFDTSEFYATGSYQPVKGQRFQLYDYIIRPYYHYYYDENVSYTEDGVTYNNIYDTLIKSSRLDTFGEDSLFNNRYLRKCLRDYNSYNRNFLPFNYGHAMNPEHISGDYVTANPMGTYVDPVYPSEIDTDERTKYTDVQGQQDTPYLPAYYNNVYADTLGDDYPNSQQTNTWFGMTMEFDFEIQNNGQIYDMNGDLQDMVFNFTGDDDVLVYIDNVLVLNVAGTHGAQMATINFATGNIAHPTDESCYPAVGIDTSESSTIKEKFEKAYTEAAQEGSNSILAGTTLNEDMFSGNTFANGTRHTLKFFYLERGGSRSFCDIYFNMETLPSSGFEVEKKVIDAEGNDIAGKDNSDYTFVITGFTSDGEALTSGTYTYDIIDAETNAVVSSNLKVEQSGTFTLKGGQKAVFKDLDVYSLYTITEIIDPCVVTNVDAYLDGTNIGINPVMQDHNASCTAASYIPVLENDISNVTFVNTVEQVCVNIKYYDREVVSGKPADMGEEPKTYVYKFYGTDIIFTDDTHETLDTEAMIAQAGNELANGEFSKVNNILDDYYLWLSQDKAVQGMQKLLNTHTGENYVETPYHTDQYGNVQTSGENWVDLSDDGKTITSWMFNCPKQYNMTVYGLVDGNTGDLDKIDGSDKYVALSTPEIITGYYNQRLGDELTEGTDEGVNDATNYLTNYGLAPTTGTKAKTEKTAVLSDGTTLNFQYWAFDAEGTQVASTDIDYLYRISGNETIYAIYGEGEPDKGLTVSRNQLDYFSVAGTNGESVEYVRLNTVMNPYGYDDNFHIGGEVETAGDGIKEAAIVYINVKNDSFDPDNLTATQLDELRAGVKAIVEGATNFGVITGTNVTVNIETTTADDSDLSEDDGTVTLVANGFKYEVKAKEDITNNTTQTYLTTKNRVQFSTTFKRSQLEKLRLFAFSAMRVVEDGNSTWIVSDNYIDYNIAQDN